MTNGSCLCSEPHVRVTITKTPTSTLWPTVALDKKKKRFQNWQDTLDVTLLIDHLDAALTRAQYAAILALLMDNFPEPWSVCPPVIERPKPDPDVTQGVCRDPLQGRHTAQVIRFKFT